ASSTSTTSSPTSTRRSPRPDALAGPPGPAFSFPGTSGPDTHPMNKPTGRGTFPRRAFSQETRVIRNTIVAAFLALGMSGAAAAQDSALTDAQVAHIAYTAGQIDIAAAEQALAKSTNPA